MKLVKIADELSERLLELEFGSPVSHVLNPLDYARGPHRTYLQRFGSGPKEIVLLGMNPGPFGMVQTGVPFGDAVMVREWLGISGAVKRPPNEHPKRPILGFECERREVSGTRLWTWARDRFGTPERFFSRFFVANYCPLAFLEESGRNRTPDKLPAHERRRLFDLCDAALRKTVESLAPRFCVGIGAFAAKRLAAVNLPEGTTLGQILHPSPASPLANKGWAERATRQLERLGAL